MGSPNYTTPATISVLLTHPLLLYAAAYREQIEAPLVMFNITEQIVILMDIRDSLMMAGAPAAAATAEVEGVIMELEVIRNTTIPAIQSQVVCTYVHWGINFKTPLCDHVILSCDSISCDHMTLVTSVPLE